MQYCIYFTHSDGKIFFEYSNVTEHFVLLFVLISNINASWFVGHMSHSFKIQLFKKDSQIYLASKENMFSIILVVKLMLTHL